MNICITYMQKLIFLHLSPSLSPQLPFSVPLRLLHFEVSRWWLGPERYTREEARVLFLCVSSCSVLCLGQLQHLFKSGTFAGQPQPAFNGQYMPGSDVFSFCLILPGNRRDLVLWHVSRRLPHLFPQVCQCFLSVVHCLKISL